MRTQEYMKESIMQSADSAKDIAVQIGHMTDEEKPCLDSLCKMAMAFENVSAGMMSNINAIAKYEPMTSGYAHHTGMNRVMHEMKEKMSHMAKSTEQTLMTAGGATSLYEAHNQKVMNAHSEVKAGTGTHQAYVEALLEMAIVSAMIYGKMTCPTE